MKHELKELSKKQDCTLECNTVFVMLPKVDYVSHSHNRSLFVYLVIDKYLIRFRPFKILCGLTDQTINSVYVAETRPESFGSR